MSRHPIRLGTGRSEQFDIPDNTEVAAVADLRPRLDQGGVNTKNAERRLSAARHARLAFDDDSKREVRAAARAGESSPSKKLVKRLRAIEEEVIEAELEYEGATAVMWDLRNETLRTLTKHAPALRAEAVSLLDGDVLRLATVHAKLREVAAAFDEHSGTLGLLENMRLGKPARMTHASVGAKAHNAIDTAINAVAEAVAHATSLMEHAKVAPLPTAAEPVDDEAAEVDMPGEKADDLGDLDAADLADDEDDE